jgi:hypothetical protein
MCIIQLPDDQEWQYRQFQIGRCHLQVRVAQKGVHVSAKPQHTPCCGVGRVGKHGSPPPPPPPAAKGTSKQAKFERLRQSNVQRGGLRQGNRYVTVHAMHSATREGEEEAQAGD